jgi:hypothetical protein
MLLHFLPALGVGQILDGGKEFPALFHPVLDGGSLIIRQCVDAGLHGGVRGGKSTRGRPTGKAGGSMLDGPVADCIQDEQHGQQQPPFVSLKDVQHMGGA